MKYILYVTAAFLFNKIPHVWNNIVHIVLFFDNIIIVKI
jgi:hypothetical protein